MTILKVNKCLAGVWWTALLSHAENVLTRKILTLILKANGDVFKGRVINGSMLAFHFFFYLTFRTRSIAGSLKNPTVAFQDLLVM